MRRSDKAGTDSESLLKQATACRLGFSGDGSSGGDGFPYLVPVLFAWDGQSLYVHCAREGEKLRRLARDERVCVEIDEFGGIVPGSSPCSFSARYRSLIGFGRARLVDDDTEKAHAMAALTGKYAGAEMAGRAYSPRELDSVAVLRIHLEETTVKQSGELSRKPPVKPAT